MVKAMERPELREILGKEIITAMAMSPQEMAKLIATETANWAPIVEAAGLKK
jgi:tripartite-type tricarboxylate transporter receptor subunit TctC